MIDVTRILCPIDFSEFSDRALMLAMRMAKWYGATLHVLHVLPPLSPSTVSGLAATSRDLTELNLKSVVSRCRLHGVEVKTEIVESAEPARRILECADRLDADLIVTGSHGRTGAQRVLLGSVVEALLHTSARPVLIVPSHLDPDRVAHAVSFGRIVCAVDFAPPSLTALAFGLAMAEEANAEVTLLHVIEMPPELKHPPRPPDDNVERVRSAAEAEVLRRLRTLIPESSRNYCTLKTTVLEGGAARQILRLADEQQADLIVLGVHSRNAFDLAFFGSNSKDVIRQAHCPVLVVPHSQRRALRTAS